VAVLGGLGGREAWLGVVRGEVGSRSGPFIGAERRFGEDILSFAELQWPAMEVREKSRRGLRPAGFSVDWLLCELSRRAGLLWPWRGGRRGSNGGWFGGDSSLPGLRVSVKRGGAAGLCCRRGPALACCAGDPAGQRGGAVPAQEGGAACQVAAWRRARRGGVRSGTAWPREEEGRWEKKKRKRRKGKR
jgi:hypothetical protein